MPEPKDLLQRMVVAPQREFHRDDKDWVEIKDVSPGIDLSVVRWPSRGNGRDEYQLVIQATPELPGERKDYSDEAFVRYDSDGNITSFRTDVFIGGDYLEQLEAIWDQLDWAEAGAVSHAAESGQLITGLFDEETVGKIIRKFTEGTLAYEKATEEPHVLYEKVRGLNWRVTLLPQAKTKFLPEESEELMEEADPRGEIKKDSEEAIKIKWGERVFQYTVRREVEEGKPVLKFIIFQDADMMVADGFRTIRFSRLVSVPEKIDPAKIGEIFDHESKTYLSIGEWLPVEVKKPI